MPDSLAGNLNNSSELGGRAQVAAEKLNDAVARANLLARDGAHQRPVQRGETRQRFRSWSRISRISGGVW